VKPDRAEASDSGTPAAHRRPRPRRRGRDVRTPVRFGTGGAVAVYGPRGDVDKVVRGLRPHP
jgi:hypothetical protein